MKDVLRLEMKNGSLGLSTGLEYESAFYSNRDEIIQLAKVAAEYNGKYISHLRSEDISMADAIDEIIEIGRQAKLPVQISHIKIALKDDWGTAPYTHIVTIFPDPDRRQNYKSSLILCCSPVFLF